MHYHSTVGILEPISFFSFTPLPAPLSPHSHLDRIRLNRLSVSDLAAFMSTVSEGGGAGSLETQHVLSRLAALGREMIKC